MSKFKYASNDSIIDLILCDVEYKVDSSGAIFTLRDRAGNIKDGWRRCDYIQKNSGYRRVKYRNIQIAAHRLVYRLFVGPLDPFKHVNHIDGDKQNNLPDNLEPVTPSENILHSFRILKNPAVFGNKKVTKEIVAEIRELSRQGLSYKLLTEKFSLSKSNISYIVNKRSWKDVA